MTINAQMIFATPAASVAGCGASASPVRSAAPSAGRFFSRVFHDGR